MVQWLRFHASTVGGAGTIPGQGTKIPHATKKKNQWFATDLTGDIFGCHNLGRADRQHLVGRMLLNIFQDSS